MTDAPAYPPPPWRLRGTVRAALWRVPLAALPGPLPDGARPLGWGRSALLATVWAEWLPGGDLAYAELVVAVPVRLGRRIGVTVTAAWVDSPASLAGGRALWAIPKRLGRFETAGGRTELFAAQRPVAAFTDRPGRALPLRLPFPLRVLQPDGAGVRITRAAATGWPRFGGPGWEFPPDGPLALLAGRQPFIALTLAEAEARFGL
ncbi:acetoacetate decarboxylase family protein [Inquilinus sp. Marseille-Q2685]|uniref:acetoacetate decarboxylase family protein n=1 Tax=Inquilinus sp. Marseille-Q2685 TaxID=2866581 RepID=UPI001CE403D6|nr:acetoacetate decarboxylase family protein [Inquilinus sp. Marseille-Q2685]